MGVGCRQSSLFYAWIAQKSASISDRAIRKTSRQLISVARQVYQSPLAMTVRLGQGAIYRIADTNTFPNRHVTVQAWRIGEFLRAGHNSTSYPGGHPSTTSLAALHIAIRFSHEMVSTRLGESWLVSGSVVERCWMFSAT